MANIGLLIECQGGRVKETCLGLAAAAIGSGRELFAILVDAPADEAQPVLAAHGIGHIINIMTPLSPGTWHPVLWTEAVLAAMAENGIDTLLGITSPLGRELLPRIAARLDAPLVMDCMQVDLADHSARTAQYSGKVIATIALEGRHRIYGIRSNVVPPRPHPVDARTIDFRWDGEVTSDLEVLESRQGDPDAQNLAEADIIISGGRGMKNGENFKLLFDCAKPLGAAVGASRVAVDNGWAPYAMQVGQTGVKVNPKVYIACGISGSVQHFAGMKTSGMIIAINSDETAAILSSCDYFTVGDLFEILPELANALADDPPVDLS